MPAPSAVAAFALAAVVLVLVPGPSVLFVVARSLALGRRAGLLSVAGNELGGIPLVAAVALGVGGVIAASIELFTIIKLVGAVYLVFLGVQAIRHRRDGASVPSTPVDGTGWRPLRQGFLVGLTNPKTIVFLVAALPQFVDARAGGVPLQMLLLGLLFLGIALICDAGWAIAAGSARRWFESSPQALSRIRATGGAMMIGLGGALAFSGAEH